MSKSVLTTIEIFNFQKVIINCKTTNKNLNNKLILPTCINVFLNRIKIGMKINNICDNQVAGGNDVISVNFNVM